MGMGMGMGLGLLVLGSACLAKLFGTAHGVVTVGVFLLGDRFAGKSAWNQRHLGRVVACE